MHQIAFSLNVSSHHGQARIPTGVRLFQVHLSHEVLLEKLSDMFFTSLNIQMYFHLVGVDHRPCNPVEILYIHAGWLMDVSVT